MLLPQFLTENRDELIARCRAKVAKRSAPPPTDQELKFGIPEFLQQLTRTLEASDKSERLDISGPAEPGKAPARSEIGDTAASHGSELLRKGYTVDQVVHDYGDLCQAITDMAVEKQSPISNDEFRTLNLCLDNAIAGAVTEFGRQRAQDISDAGAAAANERLGALAHEMRNRLTSAMLAVAAMKRGDVGLAGATGAVLDRSLTGLRDLIDRSLTEVRLVGNLPAQRKPLTMRELFDDLQVVSALEAKTYEVAFVIAPVAEGLVVNADRQMLESAIANLLQNAFKFTRTGGVVRLSAHATADRILIDIQDECGGLPPGTAEELFEPFEQRSGDRSGLGLGLSISRRAVEANEGVLRVRNLANSGCVFTIDVPRG